jgi:methyltransferase (TIGR00027 family)
VARCERTAIGADLREDWGTRLVEAGFDPARPTAWLAEGLLVYLDADEASALLTEVGRLSAPGSRLSFARGRPRRPPLTDGRCAVGSGGR